MGNKEARATPPAPQSNENNVQAGVTNSPQAEEDPVVMSDTAEFYYDIGKRLLLGKEEGMEVNRNVGMAIDYLQQAAELGHAAAEWDLASLEGEGDTITLNFKTALQIYKENSKRGHKMARTNLGVCYHKGRGTQKNTKKAVSLYQKAVKQGYSRAMYNLALCYDFGEGLTQDIPKAVELYNRSANGGYAVAQHYMGVCYYHGKGTTMDISKAIEMWTRAAMQGHPYAISCMGESFRDGQGVEKDLAQAARCFAGCSGWGIDEAWLCLSELLSMQVLSFQTEEEEPKIIDCFYERKLAPGESHHVPKLYDLLCLRFHRKWAEEGVEGRKEEQQLLPTEVRERVKYGTSTCVVPSCGKYYYGRPRAERRYVLRKGQGGDEEWGGDVVLSYCSVECYKAHPPVSPDKQEEQRQQFHQQQSQHQQQLLALTQLMNRLQQHAQQNNNDTNDNNN